MSGDESSDDEYFDVELLVRNFEKEAELLMNDLLPQKSKALYIKEYEKLSKWLHVNSAEIDENVLLLYFHELSQKLKPPSLWSIWSKLRATLSLKLKVDITKYENLKTFLSNKNKGYVPKKSKVLSLNNVNEFLKLADDHIYLATKVIIIFCFFGCLRCKEILNLKMCEIEDYDDHYIVTVNETKNYLSRSFLIGNEYYHTVHKYQSLRPSDLKDTDRFFINYQKGKCTKQFIGKNKISEVPSIVATFLQLPDPVLYTGHCFRRSSASALSHSGANLSLVKNHGGWKSDAVAQGYIDFSLANKKKIFNMISNTKTKSPDAKENHFLNRPPTNIYAPNVSKPTHPVQGSSTAVEENVISAPDAVSNSVNEVNNQYANEILNNPLKESTSNNIMPTNDNIEVSEHCHAEREKNFKAKSQEPISKKPRYNSTDNATGQIDPGSLFQNCEIHAITITYNTYYNSP